MDNIFLALITFNTGVITILLSIKVIEHFFFDEKLSELEIEKKLNFENITKKTEITSNPEREDIQKEIDSFQDQSGIENHEKAIEIMIDALKSLNFDKETNIDNAEDDKDALFNIITNIRLSSFSILKSEYMIKGYISKKNEGEYKFYDIIYKIRLLKELEISHQKATNQIEDIEKHIDIIDKIKLIKTSKKNKINYKINYLLVYQFFIGIALPTIAISVNTSESYRFWGFINIMLSLFPYSYIAGSFLRPKDTQSTHRAPKKD
jgi:hypothetical protein